MSLTDHVLKKNTLLRSIPLPGSATLPLFAATMFISALLMFGIQPMFTKMVLPKLGGSPSVWAVAMCFFQAVLLAGYAYAHFISRRLSSPRGVILHLVVMFAAFAFLPIGLAEGWGRPPGEGTSIWLLGLFAVSVGLPFFAIAGNAPLLQAWFAKTGHKHAADPYFLYGASNIGSLLALLSYPVLIEPFFTISEQSANWAAGYSVLVVFIGMSAMLMLLQRSAPANFIQSKKIAAASPWSMRLRWAGLAFVPSGLLVAVTNYISTDIASAPFLWVIPLSLFLLTFIISFQHRPLIPHKWMLAAQPAVVATMLGFILLDLSLGGMMVWLGLNLLAFFILAMVCHGELIRRRPVVENLTEFYLWMSFGGLLGGIFAGLLAPALFSSVIEYPLLVLASLLARPKLFGAALLTWRREALLASALLFAVAGPKLLLGYELAAENPALMMVYYLMLGGFIAISREKPVRMVLVAAALLAATQIMLPKQQGFESIRGFFGVNKVISSKDGKHRLLLHGTTIHGVQRLDDKGNPAGERPEPLVYYHRGGAFADVINAVRAKRKLRNVAVVGLGSGALACYKKPQEQWKFFEIDPIVIRLAKDPARFTFLSKCAPEAPVILGDARLTLAEESGGLYDMMFLDAFSSDAIPVHLLTLEAIRLYFEKLSGDGVVLFHISNRHMNLAPILAAAAKRLGLAGLVHYPDTGEVNSKDFKADSYVVVLSRSKKNLGNLAKVKGWSSLPAADVRPWSDDYSDVLGAILQK